LLEPGTKRNIVAVLGDNPLLWCWRLTLQATGKVRVANGDGNCSPTYACLPELFKFSRSQRHSRASWPPEDPTAYNKPSVHFTLKSWTYENGSLNPTPAFKFPLRGRSSSTKKAAPICSVPPYHPDHQEPAVGDDERSDAQNLATIIGKKLLLVNLFAGARKDTKFTRSTEKRCCAGMSTNKPTWKEGTTCMCRTASETEKCERRVMVWLLIRHSRPLFFC